MAPLSGEPPADAQGSQGPHNAFEEEVKALKNFVPPHRTAGASVQHEMYPHGNQRTEAAANGECSYELPMHGLICHLMFFAGQGCGRSPLMRIHDACYCFRERGCWA